MDAEKPNFVEGNVGLGIPGCTGNRIPEKDAEKIWAQMVDFAKYAFNKSHAAAYAAISMQTAYLKVHYPHEFAVGLLTSVMDKTDKLSAYVNAFRQMGIAILPPDVQKSGYDFLLEDGGEIRFGLSAIKGLGADAAKLIVSERENGPYEDLKDFVKRQPTLTKTALVGMAKAGAFSSFGYNRRTAAEGIADLQQSIRKEMKNYDENQLTLFDFGLTEAKIKHEIPKLPEYSFLEKCRQEKEAAGFYLSAHPAATVMNEIKNSGGVEIVRLGQEKEAMFGGIVSGLKRLYTKKGEPMLQMTMEDITGQIKVLAFAKTQYYWQYIHEDSLVFVKGTLKGEDEDICVFLDSFCELKEKKRKLWLGTDDVSLIELRKQAQEYIRNYPGVSDTLVIASKATRQSEEVGKVYITDELVGLAKTSLGIHNVAITEEERQA